VERIWRLPLARAAFAVAVSPWGWKAAWLPTGASTIGVGQEVPKRVTEVSMRDTSTRRRTRMEMRAKPSRLARRVASSSTPVAR
jgi:hypothetical protein